MENYQICKQCIMDNTDPDINFDNNGVCNHCHHYAQRASNELYSKSSPERILKITNTIKSVGKVNKYDCLIGVSGGIDSTYVAYIVKKYGLRPLAVHMDNGWDSELAVSNIEKTLNKLGIDLFTYVIDWEEFRDLQLSFLKASVANSEIPTDHAITAVLLKLAKKHNIKYIISGGNLVTEGIMPRAWGYDSRDLRHIKSIQKKFGSKKLKNYPTYNLFDMFYCTFIKKVKIIPILNYVPYIKDDVIALLERELDWVYYGGKHFESIYTRFFQCYILPKKFGYDKRRAHYSTLINSGQMTRDEALEAMEHDPYPEHLKQEDKDYILKKFGFNDAEFDAIMERPIKTHKDYKSNEWLFEHYQGLIGRIKKFATSV